ncbi:hypothetical protein PG991_003242 [Apiospora marii]|uniref:Heterokaryon incompatibility domain-containing protein n=1 Tax=Apiospora marii TaxID=335849 RepID=A0ABR1SJE2_9PEZI
MEHVAKYHGDAIRLIKVRVLNPIIDREIKIPNTAEQFWSFPERHGWKTGEDFVLKPLPHQKCELAVFLQAWLFFGLCCTIIQSNSKPILDYDQLRDENVLSTRKLNKALRTWYEWELGQHKTNEDRNGLRLRLIQVGYILDHARQVIRSNCACTGEDDTVKYSVVRDPLYVGDEHVLVLMCLGEALCEMKAKITRECKVDMAGWHPADDQEGWGPPRFVLQRMEEQEWCLRAVHLLRGQFSANATLLVSAYYACQGPNSAVPRHPAKDCTPDVCRNKSEDADHLYCSKHVCNNDPKCTSFGPDADKILATLKKEDNIIPLLRFQNDEKEQGNVDFEVLEIDAKNTKNLKFVAISHVWSDGWGNESANELNLCQLKLIQRQILFATKSESTPFWMDTLIVPVGKTAVEKKARQKAIRQIFRVFNASKQTIVIDNGLLSMQEGQKAETAMKILSSGWTRRLWTLQEAHLSRSIHFAFKETEASAQSLYGLEEIEQRLVNDKDPAAGINRRVKIQLSKAIMSRQMCGRGLHEADDMTPSEVSIIVANAWHAARWRTTSRSEHETLAIATLLGLNTQNSEIEEAGLLSPEENKKDDSWGQKLVKAFWEKLHETHKGAIPAVDRTLKEWYNFTKADERSCHMIDRLQQSHTKLAIIASRPPSELPHEIALLVKITEERKAPEEDCGPDAVEYCVKVIRRLYVWRQAKNTAQVKAKMKSLKTDNFQSRETKDFLVAEKLGPRQRWWVDGYVKTKLEPGPLEEPGPQDSAPLNGAAWSRILGAFAGKPKASRPALPGMEKRPATPPQPPRPTRSSTWNPFAR